MNDNLLSAAKAKDSQSFSFKNCRTPSQTKRVVAIVTLLVAIPLPMAWVLEVTPVDYAAIAIGGIILWIILLFGAIVWFLIDKHPTEETVTVNKQAIESKTFGTIHFDDIQYMHTGDPPSGRASVKRRDGSQHTWACNPITTEKQDRAALSAFISALLRLYHDYRQRTPIKLPLTYRFRFNDTHWLRPVAFSIFGFFITLPVVYSTLKSSALSALALIFWMVLAGWGFLRHSDQRERVTLEHDHLVSRVFGTIPYQAVKAATHIASPLHPRLTLYLHNGKKVVWDIMSSPPVPGLIAAPRRSREIFVFIQELEALLKAKGIQMNMQ